MKKYKDKKESGESESDEQMVDENAKQQIDDHNTQDNGGNKTSIPELQIKRAEGDKYNATYSFLNEDHTLGNLLRNQIIKSNHVEFCAYSVPHPSEPIMNVRIQCYNDGSVNDTKKVLNHGLKRISKICDVLSEKFQKNLEEFQSKQK